MIHPSFTRGRFRPVCGRPSTPGTPTQPTARFLLCAPHLTKRKDRAVPEARSFLATARAATLRAPVNTQTEPYIARPR